MATVSDTQQQQQLLSGVCFLAGTFYHVIMADQKRKIIVLVLRKMISANRRRRKMLQQGVALILRHQSMITACLLAAMLLFAQHASRRTVIRSCRRLDWNYGCGKWYGTLTTTTTSRKHSGYLGKLLTSSLHASATSLREKACVRHQFHRNFV